LWNKKNRYKFKIWKVYNRRYNKYWYVTSWFIRESVSSLKRIEEDAIRLIEDYRCYDQMECSQLGLETKVLFRILFSWVQYFLKNERSSFLWISSKTIHN
jgi:hypothetical protein